MSSQTALSDPLSTEHLHADLKGRSVRGGLLTMSSQVTQFLMQSVSTVVLARLLTPADFGLVAMVTAITGMGTAFVDLGLTEATIQSAEINHDQVSALFWINTGIGLGLTLLTMAAAPLLSVFYHEPRLTAIALVVSMTFLISGLRSQHDALLKRQMRFLSLAIRDISAYALAVPAAIAVAWSGGRYWALVVLPLTLNSTQMILSWLMVKWVPARPRTGIKVGSLVKFGGGVAASYLIYNVNRSADGVLIGWRLGASPLGLYGRAYNLLMLPVRQLGAPIGAVALPAFSRLQGDPERFARYYLRAVNLLMWVATPLFAFLFVAADPVIEVVLGHQWRSAAPVFQILAIAALGQMLLDSTLWLLVSRGQSDRLLKLLLVISPILVTSFAIGLPFGIRGVALAGSVVLLALLPGILNVVFRGTELTLSRLGRAISVPVCLGLVNILVAEMALRVIDAHGTIAQLLVTGVSFCAVYSLSALLAPVRSNIEALREFWRQR